MSELGDIADAVKGRSKDKIDQKSAGLLDLDPADLLALSRELKDVRDRKSVLEKREALLKAAILAHPDSVVGYADDFMKVTEERSPDIADPGLHELLKAKGLWDKVAKVSLSAPLLKKAAQDDEEVAAAIRWLSSRKLNKKRRKRSRPD